MFCLFLRLIILGFCKPIKSKSRGDSGLGANVTTVVGRCCDSGEAFVHSACKGEVTLSSAVPALRQPCVCHYCWGRLEAPRHTFGGHSKSSVSHVSYGDARL